MSRYLIFPIILFGFCPAWGIQSAEAKPELERSMSAAHSQAKQRAEQKLQALANWTHSSPNPAAGESISCSSDTNLFAPTLVKPTNVSDKLKNICQITPPRSKWLNLPKDFVENCEYMTFTPCEIQFRKNIQYKLDIYSNGNVGYGYPPKTISFRLGEKIPATEYGTVHITCKVVALAGALPQWICASDYEFLWSVIALPEFIETASRHQSTVFSSINQQEAKDREYSKADSYDFLQEFLEQSGVAGKAETLR